MKYIVLLSALLLSVAFAGAPTSPEVGLFDPRTLGSSPFALGGAIFLLLASAKRAAERAGHSFGPWFWYAAALVLGVAGAFGLNLSKYGAELLLFGLVAPWSVLLFGIASGAIGAGFRDAVKTAFEWLKPNTPPQRPLPPSGLDTPIQHTPSGHLAPTTGLTKLEDQR